MVTACVLQTLLGGGSSFSAGGPGRGMYSRMYQQVLNQFGWMETAGAFTTFPDEVGLFGVITITPVPHKVSEALATILADQLARQVSSHWLMKDMTHSSRSTGARKQDMSIQECISRFLINLVGWKLPKLLPPLPMNGVCLESARSHQCLTRSVT